MPPQSAVTAAYRRILRASAAAFKGDAHALAAARSEIRSHYLASATTPSSEVPSKIADSDEAASFLTSHVVQGALNERGNYAVSLEARHADAAVMVEPRVAVEEERGGGGKADDKILHFMLQANRPYAVQGVADMLATQGIRKPAAQRSLEALAAAGKLSSKEFGKARLFWKPQPEPGTADQGASPAGIAAATARAAATNEELAGVNAHNSRLARELAAATSAPSPASVADRTAAAERALPALQERFAAAQAASAPAAGPRLDRATVEKDLTLAVAAWARNKRIFQASFDAITENMDGNVKNMLAEIGVETDADAGVELGAMKALVAGLSGGGGGMKRGRA